MKAGVIINPSAGARRPEAEWQRIEALLRDRFRDPAICRTTGPGDAARLAREMSADAFDLIIAIGGDGTISETVDGILQAGVTMRPALGIISAGTGCDFARTAGVADTLEGQIERIATSQGRWIDAGRVTLIDQSGASVSRNFVNVASLGLSGATALAVNKARGESRLPGKVLFYLHTVRELIRYRFQEVSISLDREPSFDASIAVVAAANGRFFGGGMMIAPEARLDDGMLEFVIFRGAAKTTLIRDLRLVYSGRHTDHPVVTILRGMQLSVTPANGGSPGDAMIEIDGEAVGRIPATFEILPGAVLLRG